MIVREILKYLRKLFIKYGDGMSKKDKLIWHDNEWTFELLEKTDKIIGNIAREKYGITHFPNQLEDISSEQMIDAYASHAMPSMYNHWSFGKSFVQNETNYKRGRMGLAFEVVINSDPCVAYIMEENTMAMMALVIAHASYGHNNFFKENYLFQYWTSPDSIIDYQVFAKNYIKDCEEKYGLEAVEGVLDSAHALMNHGIDKYKKPKKLSKEKELQRINERDSYRRRQVDDLWKTLPPIKKEEVTEQKEFLSEPQENILYFAEKNAPLLADWQRELISIVRKNAQYFYPQMQTRVMNEGWASFWHYTLMNDLWEQDYIDDGHMLEILKSHTNVVFQPDWDDKRYNGLNPYCLGFNMFMDIKRICEDPTEEDNKWFPNLVNKDWLTEVTYAMKNFKDESFILQYLSPKVIRDMKLLIIEDHEDNPEYRVSSIHDDSGYKTIRERLAQQYETSNFIPDIQVTDFDIKGDRTLFLRHTQRNSVPLSDSADEMMKHLRRLWGYNVILESYDPDTDEVTEAYGELD